MLLFTLWTALVLGALAGAGYSHYHYRVRHNRYYMRLFSGNPELASSAAVERGRAAYVVPVVTLVLVGVLMPVSLLV
jgi:hypothetical protein